MSDVLNDYPPNYNENMEMAEIEKPIEESDGQVQLEGQNVRNFPHPVRIRWSRQPNLVPLYLYDRISECPENIPNDGFPDVRWPSIHPP